MLYPLIVQELVDEVNGDSRFKQAMQDSFTLAISTGISEFEELNIHTLDDYFRYMAEYLKWVPTETSTGRNVYMHICMFYFVIDMPPVRDWQNPIYPGQKAPWLWLSEWLIRYAKEVGTWMDSPESITPETLKTFYTAPSYHMQDYPVPPGGWKTFNEFFARHIDPCKRPIASPDENAIIVSPADSTFDRTWEVNPQAEIDDLEVKGIPWSISQLLDDDVHGSTFAGGVFTHSFLAPNDYHRLHAPVAGTVVEAKLIEGICYLEVILQQQSESEDGRVKLGMHRYIRRKDDKDIPSEHRGTLPSAGGSPDIDAPDDPGYQFLQARGLVVIDNTDLGRVAVLPIGMAQVSSVVLSVQKGDVVKKGQEISYFQMGGSDIVMVFQKEAKVQFEKLTTPDDKPKHFNFGTKVATGGGTI